MPEQVSVAADRTALLDRIVYIMLYYNGVAFTGVFRFRNTQSAIRGVILFGSFARMSDLNLLR